MNTKWYNIMFQAPALTESDKTGIIEELFWMNDSGIRDAIRESASAVTDQEYRRLNGEFGENASLFPTYSELVASATIVLGNEFLQDRENRTDFYPYKFMGVAEKPALKLVS